MSLSPSPPPYVDPRVGIDPDQNSEEQASCHTGCQHKGEPITANKESTQETKCYNICKKVYVIIINLEID
jgi:hypothetical protein